MMIKSLYVPLDIDLDNACILWMPSVLQHELFLGKIADKTGGAILSYNRD